MLEQEIVVQDVVNDNKKRLEKMQPNQKDITLKKHGMIMPGMTEGDVYGEEHLR